MNFEALVEAWESAAPPDLDHDRVGVFWALLFLCSQGCIDLQQEEGLFGPLHLRRALEADGPLPAETIAARAHEPAAAIATATWPAVPALLPARPALAA